MSRNDRFITLACIIAGVSACDHAPLSPDVEGRTTMAASLNYADWLPAINVEALPGTNAEFNTSALDGCPFTSRDGKTFFMASNRPGGLGGIDIWISTREGPGDPWGEPVNVGAPINSTANDFCPTIDRDGHDFYFVSTRPGGCGGADIYMTRFRGDGSIEDPQNPGCEVNSSADEASPFPLPDRGSGPVLYFSSTRPGGFAPDAPGAPTGDSDLYRSESHGGQFGPAALLPVVNSDADDGQPNVRRDGLEMFFFSTRPGTLGAADIYSATRAAAYVGWSAPVNLGPNVNTAAAETRPSLSWDGSTLYFGSNRAGAEGSSDIYVTTRSRTDGSGI